MRVGSFVSVLFAASLLGGVALADRPAEDGGGRSGRVQPREMRTHEARGTQESRASQQQERTVHRDTKVTERFRAKGDVHEGYGSRTTAQSKGARDATNNVKAQRDADKALHRLTDKGKAVQNCSPTDDTCGRMRVAKTSDKTDKAQKASATESRQTQEIRAMREKIRAEKLKAIIFKKLCEKNADMCSENL